MNILGSIVEEKKKILEERKKVLPIDKLLKEISDKKKYSICEKLKNNFGIIAEIKRASPSAGIIDRDIDLKKIARVYEKSGVGGISVLTCEPYFYGSLNDLKIVRENVEIPVLMKDFLIDEYQIYEGKFYGADFILLIVRILDDRKIKKFLKICDNLNFEVLVEVFNKDDLNRCFDLISEWENKILGINNRDLETLNVNIKNTFDLIKFIPVDKIIVISESGIKEKEEIIELKKAGVKGVLIGESILKSENIEKKIKEFLI
jgi:indole-3-glycerol phosphate synthase